MKKSAVIYRSKYGSTLQYARWIAEELGAELIEQTQVPVSALQEFELIVYGGGVYGGKVRGLDILHNAKCRNVIVFTVGLEDPAKAGYGKMEEEIHSHKGLEHAKIFHLRGAMEFKRLRPFDKRAVSWVMKAHKNPSEIKEIDRLTAPEAKLDFITPQAVQPIVDYAKSLS